jgi:hypothetical protein
MDSIQNYAKFILGAPESWIPGNLFPSNAAYVADEMHLLSLTLSSLISAVSSVFGPCSDFGVKVQLHWQPETSLLRLDLRQTDKSEV